MKLERIKELIDLVASSGIAELDLTENGDRLRILRRAAGEEPVRPVRDVPPSAAASAVPPARDATAVPPAETATTRVPSPMFGVMHRRPSPAAPAFVEVGTVVAAGQQLCLIEAMKVFNAVRSPVAGRVLAVEVRDGDEVAAGRCLFEIG